MLLFYLAHIPAQQLHLHQFQFDNMIQISDRFIQKTQIFVRDLSAGITIEILLSLPSVWTSL